MTHFEAQACKNFQFSLILVNVSSIFEFSLSEENWLQMDRRIDRRASIGSKFNTDHEYICLVQAEAF